jgi:glutathione S-transferase
VKFYYSHTSPFARKVHMFLIRSGVIDQCELVLTNFESDELRAQNPLGKIPALSTDDVGNLFESSLICEYLDHYCVERGIASIYGKGKSHFRHQFVHTLADGITTAAVSTVMEMRRDTHSHYWLGRWRLAIELSIATVDIEEIGDTHSIHIGTLAMIAALGYLDFRLDRLNWRDCNPALGDWFAQMSELEWVKQTQPKS